MVSKSPNLIRNIDKIRANGTSGPWLKQLEVTVQRFNCHVILTTWILRKNPIFFTLIIVNQASIIRVTWINVDEVCDER